jgi:hypothetical protein
MKKEMKMLDNGNYESVIKPIQHECRSNGWHCVQYARDMNNLSLEYEEGDPYEDGTYIETKVNFCPFCGYSHESK